MPSVSRVEVEPPVVLALDIGTSSVRVTMFDSLGRAVEGVEARGVYDIRTTTDGAAETDPERLLDVVFLCMDEALQRAGPLAERVAAVASCTFVTNLMGIDAEGQALTPLSTYADTRAAGCARALRAELDAKAVHQRTGCHLHPSYLPARFRWLGEHFPDLLQEVRRWVSFGEYLELQLFGDAAVSLSVASWSGLLNRRMLTWDDTLLDVLPITADHLSPLVDRSQAKVGLKREFAARWPLLKEVPWFPALGDGATANIGSGCTSPSKIALTVGTTSAVRAVVASTVERIPEALWCYRVDSERSLPGGALSEGGNVFAWMRDTLQLEALGHQQQQIAMRPPDVHGLTVLPFLAGERAPGWAAHAKATVHGLTLSTSPVDILQAGMEAVAYRVALVYEELEHLFPGEAVIVASGGALLASAAWRQMMADVLGRRVEVPAVEEASARGAALLALESLGMLDDIDSKAPPAVTVHEPALDRYDIYQEAIARQQALYEQLVASGGDGAAG